VTDKKRGVTEFTGQKKYGRGKFLATVRNRVNLNELLPLLVFSPIKNPTAKMLVGYKSNRAKNPA
jgi:hypothetical protein